MRLGGKVALITGGGSGIGAAIADRFVAEGAKVCITGRRQDMLDKVAQSLPPEMVTTCSGDVSKDADVARMVETTVAFGGKLDVLVNNAGISAQGAVGGLDSRQWRNVIEVNLTGPFLVMKEAIPRMIEGGGGSIINISSVGGLRGLPNRPAYCTSKAGLIMLTQQAALDYGAHKIRCNVVCPGGVRTSMTDADFGTVGKMLGMDTEAFVSLLSSEIPLLRFAEPHEIAGMCAYLASDDASFVTAAVLVVDGGTSAASVVGAAVKRAASEGRKE
ncbi:MAG TPA: SDR family oxidoreductase [Syntrophorhabdales bacterium]|nr:SDR family oxidoreductase [Syntrophorhabdales bacterium]